MLLEKGIMDFHLCISHGIGKWGENGQQIPGQFS
jgi:hypothetical protein